jgi:acyl-CoA thioesterase
MGRGIVGVMVHIDDGQFPLRDHLGMDIDETSEPGVATAWLDIDERHLNPNDAVHGGVVFTLVDTAMGRATMSLLDDGNFCASIEVSVRFLRPVTAGRLVARVEVLKAGRRVMHLEGRVHVDGDDRPVASCSGSFAVLGAPA